MPETWTTAQAALIVDKPVDAFQKAVERAPVKPRLRQRGGRRIRAFELRDLVFFCALDALKQDLTPQKQTEVYKALMRLPEGSAVRNVEVGQLKYDLDPFFKRVQARIANARELLGLIDTTGREPMIKGTTIEAYRIAALRNGMRLEEILEDYPALEEQQVLAAGAFADSNPKPGHPYPKITAKKAMREARATDADAFLPSRD